MYYYKIKSGGQLKDVDVPSMTLTGYFSKFGNIDSDKDMLMPGAFKRSIDSRGPGAKNQIWYLADHDWDKALSKPHILKEDSYGLYYEATVNKNLSYAKDVLILAQEGHYNEHSFGFSYIPDKIIDKDNYHEIHEVKLYEGSIVKLGANPETPFTGFKSLKSIESKNHYIIKEVEKIESALKVSGLQDDTYIKMNMQLLQLKQMLLSYNVDSQSGTQHKEDNSKLYFLT
jgi:HK97 family phage prohead protease